MVWAWKPFVLIILITTIGRVLSARYGVNAWGKRGNGDRGSSPCRRRTRYRLRTARG